MIVISDTSPISFLLLVGEIRLLKELYNDVIIPSEVHRELSVIFPSLPDWIRIEHIKDRAAVDRFEESVDPGEAEAIQLAIELKASRLLIDDSKGRRLAQQESLQTVGLLGVILIARSEGLIPSARQLLDRIQAETSFYLTDDIKEAALARVGE